MVNVRFKKFLSIGSLVVTACSFGFGPMELKADDSNSVRINIEGGTKVIKKDFLYLEDRGGSNKLVLDSLINQKDSIQEHIGVYEQLISNLMSIKADFNNNNFAVLTKVNNFPKAMKDSKDLKKILELIFKLNKLSINSANFLLQYKASKEEFAVIKEFIQQLKQWIAYSETIKFLTGNFDYTDDFFDSKIFSLSIIKYSFYRRKNGIFYKINARKELDSKSGVNIINSPTGVVLSKNNKEVNMTTALRKYYNENQTCAHDLSITKNSTNNYLSKGSEYKLYRLTNPHLDEANLELLNHSTILAVWDLIPEEVELIDGGKREVEREIIGLARDNSTGEQFFWSTKLGHDISVLMQYPDDSNHVITPVSVPKKYEKENKIINDFFNNKLFLEITY